MSIFYNLSIRNKLIGIILFVTILALGIGFTLVIVSNIKSFKEDMKDHTIVTTQVIGDYCVSPLIFEDSAGAEEILAKLADVPSIVKAKVYDPDGELFAEFASSDEPVEESPIVRERSSEFVDHYLHVFEPIIYKDEYYGTIYLQASTELLSAKITDYIRNMVLLVVGLIIVSLFLSFRLQRFISQPVLNLAGVARQVAKEENYSIRVQKKGNDEIGLLYDGFNNMLDQIQNREIERDKAEDALRESEKKFRTLTSNIPGAVYRCANDPDWTMDFISDVIEEISGYDASDFIQSKVRAYASIIHPDDRKMVEETVQKGISEHEPFIIEYQIIRSDGTIRWVYEKGQGIFSDDGMFLWIDGAIFDINERKQAELELAKYKEHLEELVETRTIELTNTNKQLKQEIVERKRAEEALRKSEEKYRSLLANIPDVTWTSDSEGKTVFISPNIEKVYGFTPEEIYQAGDRLWLGRIHPDDIEQVLEAYGLLFTKNKRFDVEYRIQRKDGHWIWLHVRAIGTYEKDEAMYADGVFSDITERVQAQEELKDMQAQLVQSEKMASLGMLVAGVAHEINTPVGAVSSMYDTLVRAVEELKLSLDTICTREPDEQKKVKKMFKIIEDANKVIASGTERVTNIVRRLKSFARLDEVEIRKVDIHEGLEDTLTIVHHELKHKAVVKRNFGDIPPISCNPSQLNQVFLNLFINAVQAIKNKGVITIKTFQKNEHVHIQIKDTGVGIPKEALKKIFDPGYTTKGVGVGTGLGLSICYQIVKDHHGEILVESKVGKGTNFTVVLPIKSRA